MSIKCDNLITALKHQYSYCETGADMHILSYKVGCTIRQGAKSNAENKLKYQKYEKLIKVSN